MATDTFTDPNGGNPHTWTASTAQTITIALSGPGGGDSEGGASGGSGGYLEVDVAVSDGETLDIYIGEGGGGGSDGVSGGVGGVGYFAGGDGGGGESEDAGGGGGATAVLDGSDTLIASAGGGGGSGGGFQTGGGGGGARGGVGGTSGSAASDGEDGGGSGAGGDGGDADADAEDGGSVVNQGTEVTSTVGGGAGSNLNGEVAITYTSFVGLSAVGVGSGSGVTPVGVRRAFAATGAATGHGSTTLTATKGIQAGGVAVGSGDSTVAVTRKLSAVGTASANGSTTTGRSRAMSAAGDSTSAGEATTVRSRAVGSLGHGNADALTRAVRARESALAGVGLGVGDSEITVSVSPIVAPRSRLEESLKSPYDENGEVWSALITAFAAEFAEFESALDEVDDSKFVDDADEPQLNRLATMFDVERQHDETIDEFRARLKTALHRQFTSATNSEVRAVAAVVLDVEPEEVSIAEPHDLEPLTVLIEAVPDIDTAHFLDIMESVTAVGVRVAAPVEESAEEVVVVSDEVMVHVDEVQQATFGNARWGIDHW